MWQSEFEEEATKVEEWIDTILLSKWIQNEKAFFDAGGEETRIMILSMIVKAAFEYKISDNEKHMFLHETGLCFEEFSENSFYTNPSFCLLFLVSS